MIEKMMTYSVKNQMQPIHWHDLLEINFVLSGEMDVLRNNRTFHVQTGELIILNRDDVHTISNGSKDLIYVQLHLNLELFNQYIPDIWTVIIYCSPDDNDPIQKNLKEEIKSHIWSIFQLMSSKTGGVDVEKKVIYYCIDILSSFKMGFAALDNPDANEMTEEQKGRIWEAIDYMYDHHNSKLTLHEVAQHVFVSDNYLSALLKKQGGRGFEGMLSFIRSEMSIRPLLNTDMSISAISQECGFSAPRYYNAAFSKVYGCTPAEYRKNNKSNFLMEKLPEASDILCDEGIENEEVKELLVKYEKYLGSTDYVKRNLEIDLDVIKTGKHVERPKQRQKKNPIWNYYLQKIEAEIRPPYYQYDENVIAWMEGSAVKILFIGREGFPGAEYITKIVGFDPKDDYVYCREAMPRLPEVLRKHIRNGSIGTLNKSFVSGIYEMNREYGEVKDKEQIYMNIELNEEQIVRLTIQKI